MAFAAGLTFALAALDLLSGNFRWRHCGAVSAAFLAGAANPVAALLLWVCALVALLRRRFLAATVLVVASAIPVAVIAGVFSEGGRQLFNGTDAIRAALASALVAIVVPTRHQVVRLGALLGLVMVGAAYLLPTPVGGNAIRLSLLFAVPVVAAFVDWRWWAATLAIVAAVVVQTPITLGTLTGAGAPDTSAAYYAPLLDEINQQGQLTGRVEVPEENGHWESVYVARHFPLARGWLRQLDTERNNDVFYKSAPTAASYARFLATNAVEYVAVPDGRLTYYGKRESSLIDSGLSYLDPIWKNAHWTLYRVANAVPIVEAPGTLISMSADSITFTAPAGHRRQDQRSLVALARHVHRRWFVHRPQRRRRDLPDGRAVSCEHPARADVGVQLGHRPSMLRIAAHDHGADDTGTQMRTDHRTHLGHV